MQRTEWPGQASKQGTSTSTTIFVQLFARLTLQFTRETSNNTSYAFILLLLFRAVQNRAPLSNGFIGFIALTCSCFQRLARERREYCPALRLQGDLPFRLSSSTEPLLAACHCLQTPWSHPQQRRWTSPGTGCLEKCLSYSRSSPSSSSHTSHPPPAACAGTWQAETGAENVPGGHRAGL